MVKAQRTNRETLKAVVNEFPVELRTVPEGSFETADALVFFVENNRLARECRQALIDEGLSTKILPEAITWHFAGTWDHMPELLERHGKDLSTAFPRSGALLERAVALPIGVEMDADVPAKVRAALDSVFSN